MLQGMQMTKRWMTKGVDDRVASSRDQVVRGTKELAQVSSLRTGTTTLMRKMSTQTEMATKTKTSIREPL